MDVREGCVVAEVAIQRVMQEVVFFCQVGNLLELSSRTRAMLL
jgi:hypothetical protein